MNQAMTDNARTLHDFMTQVWNQGDRAASRASRWPSG